MYCPSHFQINDSSELHRIICAHPLGALITTHNGLDANHLPFLFDAAQGPVGTLTAHIARANPLCEVPNGGDVLVIFRGEHGYITPSSYPSKHDTHQQVPTWNYEVVHAHGKLTLRDDAKFVRGVMGKLTKLHEATEATPWKMSDAPADYLEIMVQAVVGLEITLTRLEGKAKLSQNKDRRDQQGAIDKLNKASNRALATVMSRANGM